jgi:ArsR family transcriptional regulator
MALLRMCAWVDARAMDEIDTLQAEIMRTLAHPRRLGIIHCLAAGPVEVGGIARDLGISQPNASQHLAVMRAAGVVDAERTGRVVRYRLADPEIVSACALMRGVLARRLERLAGLTGAAPRLTGTTDLATGAPAHRPLSFPDRRRVTATATPR